MSAPNPQGFSSTSSVIAMGDDGSPEHFVQLARTGNIPDIGFKTNMHDTSTHDALNRGYASQIPGMKKQNDIKLTLVYNPLLAQHSFTDADGLGKLADTKTLKNWLYYPAGFEAVAKTFFAYVSEVGEPAPVDGVLMLNVTLSPTGAPTYDVDATSLVTLTTV